MTPETPMPGTGMPCASARYGLCPSTPPATPISFASAQRQPDSKHEILMDTEGANYLGRAAADESRLVRFLHGCAALKPI